LSLVSMVKFRSCRVKTDGTRQNIPRTFLPRRVSCLAVPTFALGDSTSPFISRCGESAMPFCLCQSSRRPSRWFVFKMRHRGNCNGSTDSKSQT
jgi:hypothetical protein